MTQSFENNSRVACTEKYTRGVSAVESILVLDRLRQSVAVKELEQAQSKTLSMRKTASVPNFSQVSFCFIARVLFFYFFLLILTKQCLCKNKTKKSLC